MPVKFPLEVYKRVPFVEQDGATWAFIGPDWSDATFLMHIRQNPGDTTTPLITLSNATAGTQGISCTYDPAYIYVDPKTNEEVTAPASLVLLQIDEATLEALSLESPADKPVVLNYDLHVTPDGGVKFIPIYGQFIINPGVTI